ncbi:MAG: LysR substrate-binding domain-containing protein [Woeseiaceae bacterium]|nr:LysR substrate-binding domain-containing protein [Woeseiaceae bacterium]
MASPIRNISLRELRTFCVAAENETFREAAEQLHITASAVSHQIKNLEAELGKRLFERNSRTVSLTPNGAQLFSDVQPLLAELDAVTQKHRASDARTTLRISVQPFFASELFIPRLSEFRALHPDIDINVDTTDESAEKHPSTADVSIRIFRSQPDGLASDELFPLRLIPAGSPAFYDGIRIRGKRIDSDFPLIIHESRPKAWQQWSRSSGILLPRDSSIVRMDSMIAVARTAERGIGAALVPLQLSDSWFRSGTLVSLFDHELCTDESYYLVCREELRANEGVQRFRDWVLQNFVNPG